ncbi:MAG: hypothetical protein Q8J69_01770 [Sphingobacteriaceae bacterium]|nr:hypothetical protein [Sphingobacteriaceae bacterium]
MTYSKRTKLFTGLVAGVVVLSITSLLGFFMLFLNKEQLRQNLDIAKLEQERTLSEKLLVDKDLGFLQKEFRTLDATNQQLNAFLDKASAQLTSKDITIEGLQEDNKELIQVKASLGELKLDHHQIEAQVLELSKSIDLLIKRNNEIIGRMNELAEQQELMRSDYENTIVHKGIGRSFRVDALKGERLTSKARRTRNLELSFEPIDRKEFMKLREESFYIVLSDESGGVYNLMKSQKATVYLKGNAVDIMPSFSLKASPSADKINRISLVIEEVNLKPGVYNFEVYTTNAFVGNTQIRLN